MVITEGYICRIRYIATNLATSVLAGVSFSSNDVDGLGTYANVNQPCGIVRQGTSGDYFFTTSTPKLRRFAVSTLLVTTLTVTPSIALSYSLIFDIYGNLVITDRNANNIKFISTYGAGAALVGTGVYGFTEQAFGTYTQFQNPMAIARIPGTDVIYVADTYSVRKMVDWYPPTSRPTKQPSSQPTIIPSRQPSRQPSSRPTHPTSQPSRQPTGQPARHPSRQPTRQPSSHPTHPTSQPTAFPSRQPLTKVDRRS